MRKLTTQNITQGPLLKSIIIYTIPLILSGLLQLFFNAADLIVVGHFCGSTSVAAVGSTSSLTSLTITLFIGLSVGGSVVVAQAIGAEDHSSVHRSVHTIIPLALISGIVLTFVGIFCSGSFLKLMSTPENVLPLSTLYMQVFFCGMPFNMLYNFASSILRAAGDTKTPLISLSVAGVVNFILNVIFVALFKLNVLGVALATAISQVVSAIWVVLTLTHRNDSCRLILSKIRFYKDELLKIIRIGLPSGIQASIFDLSNVIVQSSVNSFGEAFVSGNAAAASLTGFVYVAIYSFMQTTTTFVGQNVGAKNYKRVRKILTTTLACAFVSALFLGTLMYIFGRPLLSLYISDSAEAIEYGMKRLLWVGIPYFLCGLMDSTTGALRGMGASITPMLISILGVCGIRIGWIFTVFRHYHTPETLFLAYIVSWSFTFISLLIAFIIVYKKKSKEAL